MNNYRIIGILPVLAGMALTGVHAQTMTDKPNDPMMKIYRATPTKINDLVHTKLSVRFDYKKCYLYGKEWVTLKPHFYPTDSLRLDAKGMDLNNISVIKNDKAIPLKYSYDDSLTVNIHLDKVYHNNETYTIFIDYTSKPNQLKVRGSSVFNEAKGLYFINPDSSEKGKPVQIWTQGEPEGSSAWFPTIDKTDQKTTDEILMTVPAKYVSLSNGRLVSQKLNRDGTRTDDWKMELPHAPYLFMMAVGNFKIYHDHWRGKEVNYYLEPKYAPYAKQIFGMTPEIIEFFSKTLDYPFPWNKYSQIVVRDFLSGSMENTTATVLGEYVQGNQRELLDAFYNDGRRSIAHELFHQWFGDLVTGESWSNLALSESFADFSEMLWAEHKYGKDEGDALGCLSARIYMNVPEADKKDLVRFYYDNKEDMFDVVSYQKGGLILNMLRNYLGDAAFFKGLNIYLKTNAFKNAEVQQLRLALEEASGLDLNWFFNQWYYGAGHPVLSINYKWDDAAKTESVYLSQTQNGQIFKLPIAVDIYAGGKKERRKVWMNDKSDTLTFRLAIKPDLVNVDGDKVLLTQKADNKSLDEFVFQYFNAPLYLDRFEAIDAAAASQANPGAQKVLIAALKDKYYGLRIKAIRALDMKNDNIRSAALPVLTTSAQTDDNTLARAAAINALSQLKIQANIGLYKSVITSRSYAIQGAALAAINQLDPAQALTLAKGFEKDNEGALTQSIITVYATSGGNQQWPFVFGEYNKAVFQQKFDLIRGSFATMIGHVESPELAQQGISALKDFGVKTKQFGISSFVITALGNIKSARSKLNDSASAKAADEAIAAINDAK